MSSATTPTTFEQPASITLKAADNLFRLKFAAHTLFGLLLLLDSLFLILCYVTFDFYGALASPFFAWLRTDAAVARMAYFPLLAGALLASDLGLSGRQRQWTQRLVAVLFIIQIAAGFLLYFSPGIRGYFGWALLYGPNLVMPSGDIMTYCESIACLIPLGWISAVHFASSIRAVTRRKIASRMKASSFLLAAVATSLAYQIAARSRIAAAGQPFSFSALGFSLAAHVAIFLAVFLLFQWIRVISNYFPDPGLAQFVFRCICAWAALAFVLRKVVFSLLGFNDNLANWYAAVFSLVLMLFIAALLLKFRQTRSATDGPDLQPPGLRSWTSRLLVLAAILVFLYVCAVKLVHIDWAHILGSLGALAVWALLMWFSVAVRGGTKAGKPVFLALLSFADLAGLAGLNYAMAKPNVSEMLEQYASYDASLFVVQNSFKPAMQDEKYASWYDFLIKHAAIRVPVAAPQVPVTAELKATKIEKPNIFIFVIDALRRDYVSAYNPKVTFTPNMEEFARDSVVFQNAYSPYAGTALADPAIFSGYQQLNKIFPRPLSRENNLQLMLNTDSYDSYISYNSIVTALESDFSGITRLDTDRSDQLDFGPIVQELESDLQRRRDSTRPIFAFAQPTNVHTLFLAWHGGKVEVTPHPGFNDEYASAVQRVDKSFGEFIGFLKKQGLYENSIVIVTADHGESLGEMGRVSHVSNVTPEVVRVPLIFHLPQRLKSTLVWSTEDVVLLHDLVPTLYYLLGHRPIRSDPLLGRPLFTLTQAEQKREAPDHYFLMSSYGAVFGILSADQKSLFMVDATLHRNAFYDLQADPQAFKNKITAQLRDHYEQLIRQDLLKLDQFYGVSEQELR